LHEGEIIGATVASHPNKAKVKGVTVVSQLHRRSPMDMVLTAWHKNEVLCMKSNVHLNDISPTHMK